MQDTWSRRRFVRHTATVAGAAIVVPGLLAACDDGSDGTGTGTGATDQPTGGATGGAGTATDSPQPPGQPTGEPNTYRLSSRHVRNPCNACLSHNRNRYYANAEAAEADRPHPGCNCEVRGQVIPDADASTYFAAGRSVFDQRAS